MACWEMPLACPVHHTPQVLRLGSGWGRGLPPSARHWARPVLLLRPWGSEPAGATPVSGRSSRSCLPFKP